MQVNFHLLPTTEHSNGWKEASRRHNSILLPYDLAIPGEENLVVETERRRWTLVSPLGILRHKAQLWESFGVIWKATTRGQVEAGK